MNGIPFIHYAYYPSVGNAAGYHPCSNGDIPRKEFMHIHDYCEVALVRSGEFSVMSEDMHTFFHGPCLELFRKNSPHAQFDISNTTYERYLLRLSHSLPSELEPFVAGINRCAIKSITLIPLEQHRIDWLYNIMQHIEYMLNQEDVAPTEERFLIPFRCLLEEITAICKQQSGIPLQPCETNIFYVLTYIKDHLTEKITVNTIADYMHCGKTKLSTDFRKYTSMTVHQYIIKERLELSLNYLKSQYSIADIANTCGFNDSSHYIHTFQNFYGISPTQYRKEMQDH